MTGWQWFWTLIGFIVYIVVLIFLYFFIIRVFFMFL